MKTFLVIELAALVSSLALATAWYGWRMGVIVLLALWSASAARCAMKGKL